MSSSLCGCFDCLWMFQPTEIKEWVDESVLDGKGQTALCPKCGIDSVIGSESGYPITKEFLGSMQKRWFGPEHDVVLPRKEGLGKKVWRIVSGNQ